MAESARPTYRPIPPPPLPEFYLRKPAIVPSSTSTSVSDDGALSMPSLPRQQQLPPARHLPPAPVDGAGSGPAYRSYTYTTTTKLPPAPLMNLGDVVAPLAVYHICRICLRPRSARYHREHPIPIDGLPPPPGICRRCRISSCSAVGSKITAEVVKLQESGEVKLGISCLMPDSDHAQPETVRARATERYNREGEYMELESATEQEGDVVYRRVRTSAPQDRAAEVAYRPLQMMVPPPPPRTVPRPSAVSSGEEARIAKVGNPASMGRTRASRLESPVLASMPLRSASPTKGKSMVRGPKLVKQLTEPSRSSRSKHRHHVSITIEGYKPERTDSQIRRLARDEVVRYRQAERMMELHGSVYTHGKPVDMIEQASQEPAPNVGVPMQRRIALEKDIVDMPWIKSPERPRQPEFTTACRQGRLHIDQEATVGVDSTRQAELRGRQFDREGAVKVVSTPRGELRGRQQDREGSMARRAVVEDAYAPRPLSRAAFGTAAVGGLQSTSERSSSSSASSDKTRRPAAYENRRTGFPKETLRRELVETDEELRSRETAAKLRFQAADERSAKFADYGQGRHQAEVASAASSSSADQEYWLDREQARPGAYRLSNVARPSASEPSRLHLQRQPIADEVDRREPGASNSFDAAHTRQVRRDSRQIITTKIPPYPAEESIVSAHMPSPKPRKLDSKPDQPDHADGEYTYVERTVKHTRSREKPHYEVREILSQRRRFPEGQIKSGKEASFQRNDSKQGSSDISSRVHFSKQVEFSPTPPRSDASSTQFRKLGKMRSLGGVRRAETGGDLIAEYERRGRPRSRLSHEGYDYRWKRESVTAQQSGHRPAIEVDRTRTNRPAQRIARHFESRELKGPLDINVPLARAQSESPSRERFSQRSKKQREDGFGPYRTEERRDSSMAVEDGRGRSTTSSSSGSSSSGYRYVRRGTVQRGPC